MQAHHEAQVNSAANNGEADSYCFKFTKTYRTVFGVYNCERSTKQPLLIELNISLLKKYNLEEDLAKTLNHIIGRSIYSERPFLLERIAFNAASALMKALPEIITLALTIKKPQALKQAKNANVTIQISRTS
ncbi:MAG TPA: dihydroneopterin aldolase [Myxococcota bacterium]|nr:dihydroneopterin aldolase [Myxococcota bacterium]